MIMKRLARILILAALFLSGTAAVAQEYVPAPVTVSKEKVKLNGKVYLSHVVLERQTLYSISQAYGISVDDIYEANPSLRETGLQKNAIILIPYREATAAETTRVEKGYTEHVVKWYEDIEDIARLYNVSVKTIVELNNLPSKKVTTRQVLKVPVIVYEEEAPKSSQADTPADSREQVIQPEPETAQESLPDSVSTLEFKTLEIKPQEVVSFSLILPLNAGGNVSELNMDFYSGVLMAMKDLDSTGVKVNLDVYDLMSGIPPIDAIVKSDFVLGPVASRDIEAILQRVGGKVPVISPLDQKAAALASTYSNFIQAPTPVDSQYDDIGQWVRQDTQEGDKILLVTEKGASSVTASVAIRSALARQSLTYEILNYAIIEGRELPDTLQNILTPDCVNRVVVASESEAFTSDIVRNLGMMMGKGFKTVMYAPSKVRTFDTIEGSAYHDASLHISTSYFVDYADEKVDAFVRSYRALFKTEPSQFAFQGYDTAMYFVTAVSKYGPGWTRMLEQDRGKLLHADFLFDADSRGNHQNKAVRRIVYRKDYTTVLEK